MAQCMLLIGQQKDVVKSLFHHIRGTVSGADYFHTPLSGGSVYSSDSVRGDFLGTQSSDSWRFSGIADRKGQDTDDSHKDSKHDKSTDQDETATHQPDEEVLLGLNLIPAIAGPRRESSTLSDDR